MAYFLTVIKFDLTKITCCFFQTISIFIILFLDKTPYTWLYYLCRLGLSLFAIAGLSFFNTISAFSFFKSLQKTPNYESAKELSIIPNLGLYVPSSKGFLVIRSGC